MPGHNRFGRASRFRFDPRPSWIALLTVVLLGIAPLVAIDGGLGHPFAAWADDHDDDDDDGDDDDDAGGAGGGAETGSAPGSGSPDDGPQAPQDRPQPTRAETTQAPERTIERPAFAPEIVVTDLGETDLGLLIAEGFEVIERKQISALAITLHRLSAPQGVTLTAARDRVRQLPSGGDADFNHYYRTSEADPVAMPDLPCTHENCSAWDVIGWPTARIAAGLCPVTPEIGLIDTGINPDHEILSGAGLEVLARPGSTEPSAAIHGTAVASLLVGASESRVPGLLPGARIKAVDVFRTVDGDERADVAALVEGLDLLAARQVRLYNLSLSGPQNSVLSRMLDRLTDPAGLDAVIVTAAGNAGPTAAPAWPAAHPRVIAVTAVDRRGRIYPQAQRGDHLALSAPGVNLLAATSVRGARAKSGTSFAVPFVTAAAALLMSHRELKSGDVLRATLIGSARDLGPKGADPIFGHGLLSAAALCP